MAVVSKSALSMLVVCVLVIASGCRPAPELSWERAEVGLPRQAVVLALATDPLDPGRLWAGYYAPGGLVISRDRGQTWTTATQGLGDNPVFDLLLIPGHSMWAATRDGLLESQDGGATWGPASGDLPRLASYALATDDSGKVYVGLESAGVYARNLGQEHWAPLASHEQHGFSPQLSEATVLSLAVSPDGLQLYAGSAGRGLFASGDGGHTWTTAFAGDYVPNLTLNPLSPAIAVASLRDRLVRTRDGGMSWEELPIGWASDEAVSLLWLAGPASDAGHELWAGSGKGLVYCSQDQGNTWIELTPRLPGSGGVLELEMAASPRTLLAGTWNGVFASPVTAGCNSNLSWTYLSPELGAIYANTFLVSNARLLIGTRAGLFHWQPDARQWTEVALQQAKTGGDTLDAQYQADGSPPGGITALASAPSNSQVIYAGSAAGGLYRSGDGGFTWGRVSSDLEVGIRALAVAPDNANHIYILAAWERMYESHDGGHSWQARWTGLGVTTEATSLALDPLDASIIYLGTDTGLYRSHYAGEDWRPVSRPLDDQSILTLASSITHDPDKPSVALHIGATRGAYRSYDKGETAEIWGHGLEDVSVTAFLVDPDDTQTTYVGTAYAGLYRSADGGETWQPVGPPELANQKIEALAWGPGGELFIASAGEVWRGTRNK